MQPILLLATFLVVLGVPALAPAEPQADVAAATQSWVDAFNSHDLERVLALYDPEAVLWGTAPPTLRASPEAIRDYFKALPNQPQLRVVLGGQRPRGYGQLAINTCTYHFSNARDRQPVARPPR